MARKKSSSSDAVNKAFAAGKERFEEAVKAGTETSNRKLEQTMDFSKKTMEDANKMVGELSGMAKANVEALVASGQAATKGAEAITKAATDYSKASMEELKATIKSLSTAKTPKDFFEIQTNSMKAGYDTMVAEASKMTELSMKVMNDVFQPISTRMAVAMDSMTKVAK